MTDGRDRYLAERVLTASPEQLIKMLFDRAMAELDMAQSDLATDDRVAAGPHLRRAQDIIGELRCCLDLSVGQLATNLDELYGFAYNQLIEASLDGDARHVIDVVRILEPVRDAWNQACCGLQPTS